ncbi:MULTISPECIES: TlyA family RNA methyltransferase [unclassified Bosea (in: a-proteobacteria)]|uniref:TlyA family RNA methyltransferase n=1 Tax=unclassified Bosea (in: a-proteobacteria) TaxID=2653178 RepID=UPI000F75C3FA|nr:MULTISPECIES: TlyA family RNA methyltransferase [unclassified Bosea (in: a-proteobacteria)]AZO78494.1 TlyA family rRNA (cytidine-2'-O)-methyltransferase [Bosea sp. Tri-49]RXT20013.1 TlyA family rRNA (cytidine-2'-O)-methyltransferase [Bosea sp. Tri-39]RXT36885.1 TlyA family rRNA (cytidine-2'-O)-methyltransferase [Bosea sp. Tri-54]
MTAGLPRRVRADLLLLERGLFESRARAQAAIAAGLVSADGIVLRKASETVLAAAKIEAQAAHPYVSRGGVKLAAALDAFGFDPKGLTCLDVGASTGGFSDVLLRRGAAHVYAIDVGQAQLHESLHGHPRLTSLESQDIRTLDPGLFAEAPTLAVIDVSFISLKLVLPAVAKLLAPQARLIALVKPQFETRRSALKKGVLRDEALQEQICAEIADAVTALGFTVSGLTPSPIEGGDGNREFLLGGVRSV